MRRWIFRIVSVLSLLLCVALSVLWSRSYRPVQTATGVRDSISLRKSDPRCWMISRPGQLTLCWQHGKNWNKPLRGHEALGFHFGGLWGDDGSLLWNAVAPYGALVLLTAIAPALEAGACVRRRCSKESRGFAPICRGPSPESDEANLYAAVMSKGAA
jgi:hypothetical protein